MVYWIRFWLALSQMDNSSKMRARGRQAGRHIDACLQAIRLQDATVPAALAAAAAVLLCGLKLYTHTHT